MSDHNWEAYYQLKPENIFVECGAFYGDDVASTLAKIGHKGRALFIEPNPQACTILHTMINELGCSGTFKVANCPVWKVNEVVDFYNMGGTTSYIRPISERVNDPHSKHAVEMQARTVDSLIQEYNIPRVDLLVADIEGPEFEMIQGCIKSLKAGIIKNMSICVYHVSGTEERIIRFLNTIGSFKYRSSEMNRLPVLHINPREEE